LVASVLVAVPALGSDDVAHHATILNEVQKHLDGARDCEANGTPEIAAAHANLVLVDDEVTYAVQFVGIKNNLHDRCEKALQGALDAWEKSLDDTISFREITDPAQADIVIRFKPDVMMGKEPVAGYANWKRTLKFDGPKVQSVSFKSDLQIRTINLSGGSMPFECVRHEIAHEVGHILGLEDSDMTGDLMGPLDIAHPVGGPQPYEASAVRHLRDEAHKLRTDALARCTKTN